jgi:molybdate transport system ATP-binding protein
MSLQLGVAPLLARDMQTLSTGELRKVLIARAVVGAPAVLLLDEVCDGLDARFRRGLLEMLETIAARGCQLVYTTHRTDEGLSLITHELLFDQGRVVRQGPLLARDARSCHTGRVAEVKPVEPIQRRTEPPIRGNGSPLIRIENAEVFLDRVRVLHGLHWELRRGEHWAVLGGNGAGKTTFLKLVASDLYAAFGARVSRFEFTADDTIWDLRRRIGCVSPLLQTHYREQLTGEQVICSGFFASVGLMEQPSPAQRRKARSLLKEFHLEHLRSRSMLSMSFGELRKILTLRALVHDPELVIFDEPFDGLDGDSKRDFASALEKVAARGAQLVIVTHHLDDLPSCMTHGMVLEKGEIVAAGPWPMIRRHEKVAELFGV